MFFLTCIIHVKSFLNHRFHYVCVFLYMLWFIAVTAAFRTLKIEGHPVVKGISTKIRPTCNVQTRVWQWLFLVGVFSTFSGCSLFVMAGKMLFGDPLIVCDFTSQTHVNLEKEGKKVLVICTSPEAVKLHWPSLDFDILEGVSRNLTSRGIEVVNLDDVAHWIDDNGGEFEHPSELAEEFDADYIVHIDLNQFSYLEENSRDLYRGRATGNVMAYEVVRTKKGTDSRARAMQVFSQEFTSEYPSLQPIPAEQITDKSFRQKYLEELSRELSRKLYNYRMEDTF